LALERHATSKLRTTEDLLGISTLGFRGEALPSIAAVARVLLETRLREESAGTRIEIHGGKIQSVKEVGCAAGTVVEVRNLFYNVPARRKFLRSDSTELGHVTSLATHYALAHPDRAFRLKSGSQTLFEVAPVERLRERAYQLLGRQTFEELVEVNRASAELPAPYTQSAFGTEPATTSSPGTIAVEGFISRPEVERSSAANIYIFVNRRLVRDRMLLSAIREAYRNILPARSYPMVLLFLELPPSEVDVNVHPQKIEVRFRHTGFVHDFALETLWGALTAARPPAQFPTRTTETSAARASTPPLASHTTPAAEPLVLRPPTLPPVEQRLPLAVSPPMATAACVATAIEVEEPLPAGSPSNLEELRPLGQIANSFIVAAGPSGLWLIDQHVAHERVLFEQHLRARGRGQVEGQRLLTPALLELSPRHQAVWEEIARELEANGFEIERFGARTLAVQAGPAGVAASEIERLLEEIFTAVEHEASARTLDSLQRQIAASVSCHAAIKVNMPLTTAKMEWLLRELARTEAPMTCPHGRPVVLHYSLREIQKAFKRI
ncbi:MAG: DNA mismatch repair endonuclease MutL, partial [Acidobacteria bacterium]|nr:DNA mismatch repair endonuclease MutL [Acidobacteriota bacterium]